MPQIDKDAWKAGHEYYWFREYSDGHTEYQFDPETGQETLWGPKVPEGLVRAGWIPINPDIAGKIAAYGEFGYPTQDKPHVVNLSQGDELIMFRECTIVRGSQVTCKLCGQVFLAMGEPGECSRCGAAPVVLDDGVAADLLPNRPASWESVVYSIGIKGKFSLRFNGQGLVAQAEEPSVFLWTSS